MTTQEKLGLQQLLRYQPTAKDHETQQAVHAALNWIARQVTLDERRRGPRGKYNRR